MSLRLHCTWSMLLFLTKLQPQRREKSLMLPPTMLFSFPQLLHLLFWAEQQHVHSDRLSLCENEEQIHQIAWIYLFVIPLGLGKWDQKPEDGRNIYWRLRFYVCLLCWINKKMKTNVESVLKCTRKYSSCRPFICYITFSPALKW